MLGGSSFFQYGDGVRSQIFFLLRIVVFAYKYKAFCVKWLLLPGNVYNIRMCVSVYNVFETGKINVVIL